jgi:hypothetical protein
MKKKKEKPKTMAELVGEYLSQQEQGKAAYARSDEIAAILAARLNGAGEIALEGGLKAVLKDNFATAENIVWKPCGFRKWEIKVVKA